MKKEILIFDDDAQEYYKAIKEDGQESMWGIDIAQEYYNLQLKYYNQMDYLITKAATTTVNMTWAGTTSGNGNLYMETIE
jgi:hypothetical protein